MNSYDKNYYENGIQLRISGYKDYKWLPSLTLPMCQSIIDNLQIKSSDIILDFGCAKGYLVKAFNELGIKNAFGVDISDYAINNCDIAIKDNVSCLDPNSPLEAQIDHYFDWIICKDVLEHIEKDQLHNLLKQFSNLTNNIFIVVPLGDGKKYIIEEYENDTTHVIRENIEWWLELIKSAGFQVSGSHNFSGVKENWKHYTTGNAFIIGRKEQHMNEISIEQRYNQLVELKGSQNWLDIRSTKNFELKPIQYQFGTRNTYVPIDIEFNKHLQDSRGNGISDGQTFETYISSIKQAAVEIDVPDRLRINELDLIIKSLGEIGIRVKTDSLCEIGFRNPHLLQYYLDQLKFQQVVGYDISDINVQIGKSLGYDCRIWDINDVKHKNESKHDIVICYHVLEHTYDPVNSLKNISESMNSGGLIHIEIPIEPGQPRLNYGHLIALEKGDLLQMLLLSGFEPQSISTQTHPGGSEIERISAIKK
jgi:2-polyprenyl-3-methyl-5-hydroxy-6-metoxy-1,4-benzoquinol methylase